MIIFPAIDIKDNKCVRLLQGDFDKVNVYGDDPSLIAKKWQNSGAEFIHMVSLNGARGEGNVNDESIKTILDTTVHVAHDCELGSGLIIGNSTKFAGEVVVDDNAIVSANVLVHQFCHIAGYVMIQGGCRFSQDIPPYIIAGKEPTRYCSINLIGLRRRGFSNETIQNIHEAYRLLYSKGILKEGIEEIKKNLEVTKEIQYIIDFVESSQRGIIR